jgi:ADP-ribose pyrophosphatase
MEQEPQLWTTLGTQRAFENRWIKVDVDRVELPDGTRYDYTRLEPPGIGVAVLGFNAAGAVLLEREYRHGVAEVIWQLPGGLADDGEDLRAAGLRELREETGFAPQDGSPAHVRYLGMVWDNPAFGVAQSHIYAAWGLVEVAGVRRDAAEMVSLHWQPVDWLREAVRTGIVKDRVLVAAVAYLLLNGWMDS